jgi:hypothetical protein
MDGVSFLNQRRNDVNTKIGIICTVIAVVVVILGICFFLRGFINTNFATNFYIRVLCVESSIASTIEISDENTIAELQRLLRGRKFRDSPSCGFSNDISIIAANQEKNVVFSLALDGCPKIRINNSNEYISITEEDRTLINAMFEELGVLFPFI